MEHRACKNEEGQSTAEYALIVGMISVVLVVLIPAMGLGIINAMIDRTNTFLGI